MRIKYDTPKPGEWLAPKRKGYRLMCCDCGLTHIVNFRIAHQKLRRGLNEIQIQIFRDNRATSARRRARTSFVRSQP